MNAQLERVLPSVIVGLGKAAGWLLNAVVPEHIWHSICQETTGHNFVTDVLHTENQSVWVIDPHTCCRRCGVPMPESVYEEITAAYTLAVAVMAEMDDEDLW